MKAKNELSYDQLLSLNSHLIKKNEKLRAEIERRNNYIADISHRLRIPLNSIYGLTSIAQGNFDNPNILSDCIDKIRFSAQMILNTANEILELDAVRKGNLSIHNVIFDFKLLLSSISSMCSLECGNKDILYNVILNGVTEEKLVGDTTYLNRMLIILMLRAVEATDSGGRIRLQISQREITKDSVHIQFCITDSGRALTAEEVEHYTNGDEDSDIVLAKNLCTLMNGTFSFESKNGLGSIFSVTIPFGISASAEPTAIGILDSYRVLLVSDDADTIDSVTEVLGRIGTECVFVPDSGKALVAILDAATMCKDFNLCLVDWGCSIHDGIEKTKIIREAGSNTLKIAAVTTDDSDEVKYASKLAGADRVLAKPLFQSTVFNLMMELTGREYTKLTANPTHFDFTGCRVLLAEDNDLNAVITATQLEAVGIITDRSENGEDCFEAFRTAKSDYYDLILLDMKMPYMDGCQTAKAIRSLDTYSSERVPIIALTADALQKDVASAFEAGMNDYIVKPIDTFQLCATLAKHIKKNPQC